MKRSQSLHSTTHWISKGARVTYVCGPAIRPVVQVQEGVFLLQAEPRLGLGMGLHEFRALMTIVVLVRGAVVVPAFCQDTNDRVSAWFLA